MALLLGVDTGGTYTDAVLIRDESVVIASAKALTTRHDLSVGIGEAMASVLDQAQALPSDIALASLSTTLATNALVEGQGNRVCLVFIGFGNRDIARQGLDAALKGDPVIVLGGGHTHAGGEAAPFDADALRSALQELNGGVSGFAVASQFATRNPEHEVAARQIIRDLTGAPVTCSHELSAKLGGPKRAMTAVLNARLIGMIDHLISATETKLRDADIQAPLMVVRGDGALISAELARERPIETILSGPAASIVGARWLTDETDALVSDIGGTTTDVAVLRGGRPMIDPQGARVGGFRTMVEAVAMRTTGLGGDSEVSLNRDGLNGGLHLGPRRLIPISLCAMDWPDLVHDALNRQLATERAGEFGGRFVVPIKAQGRSTSGLSEREAKLLKRLGDQASEMSDLLKSRLEISALDRLVGRGLVMISGVTPSDASHVLEKLDSWDSAAALKAVQLFGRLRTGSGERLAKEPAQMAQMIVDRLTRQTAETLLETAFAEDSAEFDLPVVELARHVLTRKGLDHHRGILALDAGLNLPVIGLGASASSYYGAVGERLNCKVVLPEHAGVANAVGAVVGQISMRLSGQVTGVGEGQYRVHFVDGPQDFSDQERALSALETRLGDDAIAAAKASGAEGVRVRFERDIRAAEVEGKSVFVEAEITATASGRPRIAV